jgi:hypothetical protein
MAILNACDNRGEAEDLDDTTSTSGSDAPGGDLTTQREDISVLMVRPGTFINVLYITRLAVPAACHIRAWRTGVQ